MNVAWLVRVDGVGNFTTATTTSRSFSFDGTTYTGGVVSVSPPNERAGMQDQWSVELASQLSSVRNDVLAQGAPASVELELLHDPGSGWASSGVAARGQLSAPLWQDTGNWRVTVDTSPGDADRGDPLMWNADRDTGMAKMGAEAESVVLAWPPGE